MRYNISMKTVIIEGENGDFTMMRHGKNITDIAITGLSVHAS